MAAAALAQWLGGKFASFKKMSVLAALLALPLRPQDITAHRPNYPRHHGHLLDFIETKWQRNKKTEKSSHNFDFSGLVLSFVIARFFQGTFTL